MITTKSIKPDKKELFEIILITRLKPLLWLCGLLFLYLLLDFIFKLNNGGIFPYLFTVFLISVIIIIGLWRSLNSEKNKMHFIERYFEIDNEKIFSKHIDGSSSTTMIHNYKEVKRIKKGYIFTFIDSRIWFLPFYAFNNYDELSYFEIEVADKINRNTYFRDHSNIVSPINFGIPEPHVKYKKRKVPIKYYFIGLLFLIPLWGAIIGFISLLVGILSKRNKFQIIYGCIGIFINLIVYLLIGYDIKYHRGGVHDKAYTISAKYILKEEVYDVEFYKVKTGNYPKYIEQIENLGHYYEDPILTQMTKKNENKKFYYQLITDSTYTIFSVGFDKTPFTKDDVYPDLSPDELKKYGFRKINN